MNVVEADHGDVVGDGAAGVFEGADGADGGDVVEAEDGGEVAGFFEQGLHGLVADFRGHGVVSGLHGPALGVDADDVGGVDFEAHLTRYLLDAFPAELGVGDGAGAAHEGDAAVAEIVEVARAPARRRSDGPGRCW